MARSVSQVGIKVTVDDKDLQALTDKFGKLEKEMKESKDALKQVNAELKKMSGGLKKTQKDVEGFIGNIKSLGRGIHGVGIKFLFFKHLATQAFHAVDVAARQLEIGAELHDLEDVLSSSVQGFDEVLKRSQAISRGLMGKEQLLRSAALMRQFGMDIGRLDSVTRVMSKTAISTGQSVDFMLDSFTRGVARLSPLILDNLGITLSLKEAYEAYALQIGGVASELTKAQQIQAVFNASIDQLNEKTRQIDLDKTLTAKVKSVRTGVSDKAAEARVAIVEELFGDWASEIRNVSDLDKVATSLLSGLATMRSSGQIKTFAQKVVNETALSIRELSSGLGDMGVEEGVLATMGQTFEQMLTAEALGDSAISMVFEGLPETISGSEQEMKKFVSALAQSKEMASLVSRANSVLGQKLRGVGLSTDQLARSMDRLREEAIQQNMNSADALKHVLEGLEKEAVKPLGEEIMSLLASLMLLDDELQRSVDFLVSDAHARIKVTEALTEENSELQKGNEFVQKQIQLASGSSRVTIALAAEKRRLAAVEKEMSDLASKGILFEDKKNQLLLRQSEILSSILQLTMKSQKLRGPKRAKLMESDLLELDRERFETAVALGDVRDSNAEIVLREMKFHIDMQKIKESKLRTSVRQHKVNMLEVELARDLHSIRQDIAKQGSRDFQRIADMEDKVAGFNAQWEHLQGAMNLEKFTGMWSDVGSVLNMTTDDMHELVSASDAFVDFFLRLQGDSALQRVLSDAGISMEQLEADFLRTSDSMMVAINNAKMLKDVLSGIDDVAKGIGDGLSFVNDGLQLLEEDFGAAKRAYDEAVESGQGAEELAELARGVEQADWERFKHAMQMAEVSMSAIQQAPDMKGKIQGALQGIQQVGAAFIDDGKERAAFMAAMEAAMAIAAFASQDYIGGAAHTIAAGMFAAIAAGAIKPPTPATSGMGKGAGRGGGGSQTETTINVHMSGLTTLTEAEVGAQIYQALGQAQQQGYVP